MFYNNLHIYININNVDKRKVTVKKPIKITTKTDQISLYCRKDIVLYCNSN